MKACDHDRIEDDLRREERAINDDFFRMARAVVVAVAFVLFLMNLSERDDIRVLENAEPVEIALSAAAHNRLQAARNICAMRDAQERAMDLEDDLGRVERAINELNQKGKP